MASNLEAADFPQSGNTPSAKKSLLRNVVNWIFLPLGGVLLSLLLAEGMLRVAGISFPVFDIYDDVRGVALMPGLEGWYKNEGNAYLKINSLGYRDSEHDIAKPPGTYRIAVLGDSFAEARQVAQENTFWSLMGRDLGKCPELKGKRVEMLNFGIGGYGTAQELLTLRKDALRFSPDLVLLAFYPENDFQDNSKELSAKEGWRMPAPYFVRSNEKLILDNSFRQARGHRFMYQAVQHSRALQLVNEARRHWQGRKMAALRKTENVGPIAAAGIFAPPTEPDWQESWKTTEELLETIHREARASGAQFEVATISMPVQVYPDPAKRQTVERRLGVTDLFYADRGIAAIGRQHDFPVINLAERLQQLATEQRIFLHGFANTALGEGHLNEAGHRYTAEILVAQTCAQVLTQAP